MFFSGKPYFLFFLLGISLFAESPPDSVIAKFGRSSIDQFGKLWTFEHFPTKRFEEKYSFCPDSIWISKVMNASLKLGDWCSASFVSDSGLILTNYHCVEMLYPSFEENGQALADKGFYATNYKDEIRIPGLYADRIAAIKDISAEYAACLSSGKNIKVFADSLLKHLSDSSGYKCNLMPLYNGLLNSVVFYKRYNDIRLVFSVESSVALFGGDADNFTYPRYNLDFTFLRIYENDKPLYSPDFFRIETTPVKPGDAVFISGFPAETERYKTVAQLEYLRDYEFNEYLTQSIALNNYYLQPAASDSSRIAEIEGNIYGVQNAIKAYKRTIWGLDDKNLMSVKIKFEKLLRTYVENNEILKPEFSHLWESLERLMHEKSETYNEIRLLDQDEHLRPVSVMNADYIVSLNLNESENDSLKLDSLLKSSPKSFHKESEYWLFENLKQRIKQMPDKSYDLFKKMFYRNNTEINSSVVLEETVANDFRKLYTLIMNTSKSDVYSDPLLYYSVLRKTRLPELKKQFRSIIEEEKKLESEYGRLLLKIFGKGIPPDANAGLRISDGVVKSYNYNGTIAPINTTFFGLFDKYYSFGKKKPWLLSERWMEKRDSINLKTPLNFISTNDIQGGNSGSPVININGKLTGLAFDGNIENIESSFLYQEKSNRAVSVSMSAILEVINNIYCTKRLYNELIKGINY